MTVMLLNECDAPPSFKVSHTDAVLGVSVCARVRVRVCVCAHLYSCACIYERRQRMHLRSCTRHYNYTHTLSLSLSLSLSHTHTHTLTHTHTGAAAIRAFCGGRLCSSGSHELHCSNLARASSAQNLVLAAGHGLDASPAAAA